MTSRPGGGHPFTVAAWILVGAVVVAAVAGVMGGILSSSLVVDLAALWPLLVVAVVAGLLSRLGKRPRKARAILPLGIFTALVLGGALHLGGWDQLPSAAARLTGPPPGEMSEPTELVAQLSGEVQLHPLRSGPAYRVSPILLGGNVGVPMATETSVDGSVSVRIEADGDAPSWYSFAGWRIGLSPEVPWRLVLNGRIEADLAALAVTSAAIAGSGSLRLGQPPADGSNIIIAGDFDLSVPAGTAVVVSGEANVPAGWETGGGRARSPGEGAERSWSISVQGEVVPTIRER
ncbi:MAG TPA: hypothetical protein VHL52_10060 [Acidimicrobiia bacterium]|nr:hypothetical protein [Acidimicrobiia bacterium]